MECLLDCYKQRLDYSKKLLIEYYKKLEQVVQEEYLFQKELNEKINSSF